MWEAIVFAPSKATTKREQETKAGSTGLKGAELHLLYRNQGMAAPGDLPRFYGVGVE